MEEKPTMTVQADKIKYFTNERYATLYLNGLENTDFYPFIPKIDLSGDFTLDLGEHFVIITTDEPMEVTVSYYEDTWEGETFKEDFVIESIDVRKT